MPDCKGIDKMKNANDYILNSDYELPERNKHIIKVKFLGPTNHRGARIKLYSGRYNQSVTLDYSYHVGNVYNQAAMWLNYNGFEPLAMGEGREHYYIICETFKLLK